MIDSLILLLFAITPGVLISLYIFRKDKYEPEPVKLLFICFVFGMLSTIPAIMLETFGMDVLGAGVSQNILKTAFFAFIVVGLSEEFSKFIFLRYYIMPKRAFNEPMDGIVYSVMISMGFACWENILYAMFRGGGYDVAILRAFTAVPAHAAFAVIMGYFAGKAKTEDGIAAWPLFLGLFWATVTHGAYDFFIFQLNFEMLRLLTFGVLILAIIVSFVFIARLQKHSMMRMRGNLEAFRPDHWIE